MAAEIGGVPAKKTGPRSILEVPDSGLRLDKDALKEVINVVGISVLAQKTQELMRSLRGFMLELPRVRVVRDDPSGDTSRRLILLDRDLAGAEGLPEDARAAVEAAGGTFHPTSVEIGYDNMGTEGILRRLLPPEAAGGDLPTSFEMVGHLAHLNLRDELLAYRRLIGDVILAKNPVLRTVVNKVGTIETQFRTFPMEVIAGEDVTDVEVRHCGVTFRFDFRRVYWNSRLQREHERMAMEELPPGAVVADMFCGVGPFVIPLAMREIVAALPPGVHPGKTAPRVRPDRVKIHGNDLNPASYAALVDNVKRNHVEGFISMYNMDGRDFMRRVVREEGVPVEHVLMNLPADAISFCDVFRGLYTGLEGARGMPIIHVYCFSKSEDFKGAQVDVMQRVLEVLGLDNTPGDGYILEGGATRSTDAVSCAALPGLSIREVRDVAPKKLMLCASFPLPSSVAYEEGIATEPPMKRGRTEDA